jgi:hypothetical protein
MMIDQYKPITTMGFLWKPQDLDGQPHFGKIPESQPGLASESGKLLNGQRGLLCEFLEVPVPRTRWS